MEGHLYKWTNYVSRWQNRWFILDAEKGILSYFENEEGSTILAGCRGSWKISDCDLIVDSDAESFQLLSAGGAQRVYLRAGTPQERALWLKALAHTKMVRNQAELAAAASKNDELPLDASLNVPQPLNMSNLAAPLSVSPACVVSPKPAASALQKRSGNHHHHHGTVVSYIRQLCAANASKTLRVNSGALRARCDAIIARLEASKRQSEQTGVVESLAYLTASERQQIEELCDSCIAALRVCLDSCQLTTVELGQHSTDSNNLETDCFIDREDEAERSSVRRRPRNKSESSITSATSSSVNRAQKRACDTVFNALESAFASVLTDSVTDAAVGARTAHCEVDVDQLVSACRDVTLIFDFLNASAFAPVKMDIIGNVRKIQAQKSAMLSPSGAMRPVTLRELIGHEVQQQSCVKDESATVGVLWLTRALEFVLEFLRELLINTTVRTTDDGAVSQSQVKDGEVAAVEAEVGGAELGEIAEHVYQKTLARYHDWVVRGMFKLAIRTLPGKMAFVRQLLVGLPRSRRSSIASSKRITSRQIEQLLFDIDDCVSSLDAVICEIRSVFMDSNLMHLFETVSESNGDN